MVEKPFYKSIPQIPTWVRQGMWQFVSLSLKKAALKSFEIDREASKTKSP